MIMLFKKNLTKNICSYENFANIKTMVTNISNGKQIMEKLMHQNIFERK